MKTYDYIIAGAGAAGLSLVIHMIDSGKFGDKRILLIDRTPKTQNDRTWCFWEETPGLFESIVFKKWNKMWFHGCHNRSQLHDIAPYEYKMIRGIDFYRFCFDKINGHANISVRYGVIEDIFSSDEETYLILDGERLDASFIFSSIPHGIVKTESSYFLCQHFKGWFIETHGNVFDPSQATLMDFRISQGNDTRFVYVMPFSSNRALVEYTVFSENKLTDAAYNEGLTDYCKSTLHLNKDEYEINEEEFGMIPMTNYVFPASNHNIIFIGSAGGQTKGSSGYTFRFIQKHSTQIVDELIENNYPYATTAGKRFNFYDSILLRILTEKKLSGAVIFTKLFEQNAMSEVFKFLDNETSLAEDIKLISSLPKSKFFSAAVAHLLK